MVTHLGDNRLFILKNAAFTYGDYVDFLTTYLSFVHVIIPDDLVGTQIQKFPPKRLLESAPKPKHEEGVTPSFTLAPPILLLHLSTNTPPLKLLTKD